MKSCEDIRILLVEDAYDEISPEGAEILRAHLEDCPECTARQQAFGRVRGDLQSWEAPEAPPSRVTFVTTGPPARSSGMPSWQRGLAAAASFIIGFLLIAAVVNLEVGYGEDGWSLRTSLMPRPVTSDTAGAGETSVADRRSSGPVERIGGETSRPAIPVGNGFMSENQMENWLDQRLRERGLANGSRPVAKLEPEQVQPILENLLQERDQRLRGLVQDMLANVRTEHREELATALTDLYQTVDAQRTNDLLFLAGELGVLQEATGLELQRTNAAIDYLISLEAAEEPALDTTQDGGPEQPERQEPERQPQERNR